MEQKEFITECAEGFENMKIELEQLSFLTQLYNEHRENELGGLRNYDAAPWAGKILLGREHLGAALLSAITDKLLYLQERADLFAQKAREQA